MTDGRDTTDGETNRPTDETPETAATSADPDGNANGSASADDVGTNGSADPDADGSGGTAPSGPADPVPGADRRRSPLTRRTALTTLGLVGVLGLGSVPAGADPQGQVGTSGDPLNALYTEELNGGVTGDAALTDLPGDGLTLSGGALTADLGNGLGFDGSNRVEIPPGAVDSAELASDSVTVAGNTVALGSSTGVAHGDLSGIASADHHARPTAGSGLAENAGAFDVATGSTTTVSSGTLDVASGAIGTTELGTPFADLATLVGSPVTPGATVQAASGNGLTFAVDGGLATALVLSPSGDGTVNVVAGNAGNAVSSGRGGTVGGGGGPNAGEKNRVYDDYGTVGGGLGNVAGRDNSVNDETYATVAGGRSNQAGAKYAFVGGGELNEVAVSATDAVIAGGTSNTVGFNSNSATIGGGENNTADARNATVPGGSLGAAENGESFVWNDASNYHSIPNASQDGLSSATAVNGEPVTGGDTFSVSAQGGVRFVTGGSSVTYIDGGTTGWATKSARSAKTNVDPVDPGAILDGVTEMEVATWEYADDDGEGQGVTHVGPMAGEFHEVVDVGTSDDHINSVNADGVAFSAIQGLAERLDDARADLRETGDRVDELASETDRLRAANDDLRETNDDLREANDDLRERNERLREETAELRSHLERVEARLGIGDSRVTDD